MSYLLPATVGQTAPEPWIQTPAFMQDRARRVHAGLMALNDELTKLASASRLDPTSTRWRAWKGVLAAFGKWYGDAGPTTWLWSGTAATLDHYEAEIAAWQRWLRQAYPDVGAALPPAPTQYNPDGRPRDGLPWYAWLAIGGAGAALLYAVTARR